jgi:hypothetical protein
MKNITYLLFCLSILMNGCTSSSNSVEEEIPLEGDRRIMFAHRMEELETKPSNIFKPGQTIYFGARSGKKKGEGEALNAKEVQVLVLKPGTDEAIASTTFTISNPKWQGVSYLMEPGPDIAPIPEGRYEVRLILMPGHRFWANGVLVIKP